MRVGGKDVEGTILPAGPVLVADQLPAGCADQEGGARASFTPTRRSNGKLAACPRSQPTGFDAGLHSGIRPARSRIKGGTKPGTPEFRSALRDAIESAHELVVTQGVMDMTPHQP